MSDFVTLLQHHRIFYNRRVLIVITDLGGQTTPCEGRKGVFFLWPEMAIF